MVGATDNNLLLRSGSNTALTLDSSQNATFAGNVSGIGTCTATTFSGSGASLTSLPAANITGTLPSISGANLTSLNATNISSGTIAAARVPTLNQNTTGSAGSFTAGSASNLILEHYLMLVSQQHYLLLVVQI